MPPVPAAIPALFGSVGADETQIGFVNYLDGQLISHDSLHLLYSAGDADVRAAAALGGAIYNTGAISVTGSTFVSNAARGGTFAERATDFILKTGPREYAFDVARRRVS